MAAFPACAIVTVKDTEMTTLTLIKPTDAPARMPCGAEPNLPIWREMFAGLDWLALRASPVYRGEGVPQGDGAPVVVVPGFLASDLSLVELHRWLGRVGYRPYYSGIGRNVDCPRVMVERLIHTIEKAHRETGRKVTLVGHSLGGLLARGAAIKRPDLIERVITVGSPINGVRAHPAILAAAHALRGDCLETCIPWLQSELPAGVTAASIYSPTDGVVDPATCLAPGVQAIEVRGTHTGLVANPNAFTALATLLTGTATHQRPALRVIRGGKDTPATPTTVLPIQKATA
jgi:pimeloyl-ACP methyl ester carboxylesterase